MSQQEENFENNTILAKESNHQSLLKDLKEEIDKLEKEKMDLLTEVGELREKTKNINIANNPEQILLLEKERDETKKTASEYLSMCSQLAEELIILRNKLDKFNHTYKNNE